MIVSNRYGVEGSPAHAGIDPGPPSQTPTPSWFPRTRGDRPAGDLNWGFDLPVPPHTRG